MSEQSRSQDSCLNSDKNGDTFSLFFFFSFSLKSSDFVFNDAHLMSLLGEIVNITKTLRSDFFVYKYTIVSTQNTNLLH